VGQNIIFWERCKGKEKSLGNLAKRITAPGDANPSDATERTVLSGLRA